MALCCLCKKLAPADHRRRKKFHGSSCATARETLDKLSLVPLQMLVEINNPEATLCNVREKKLSNIHTLEVKLDG